MRKRYPSDISKEAFEEIRPLLESVRKQTKPRTVDLYEVFRGGPAQLDRNSAFLSDFSAG
jgi:hypothetical protein